MSGSASVMTRENCLKLNNTLIIARLHTTKERGIFIAGIVLISIAVGNDARVNTLNYILGCYVQYQRGLRYTNSSIAVPDVGVDLWKRFTGIGINKLDVHVQWDSSLTFDDILANKFTPDVCFD